MDVHRRTSLAMALLVGFAWAGVLVPAEVRATEQGRNPFPSGLNGEQIGNIPPPGFYLVNEFGYIHANRFNDASGNKLFPNFKLDVAFYAPRLLYNTGLKLAGGDVMFQAIQPFVYTALKNRLPPGAPITPPFGESDNFAAGDLNLAAIIGWHDREIRFGDSIHYAVSVELVLPTGEYHNDYRIGSNAGLNTLTISPGFEVTYFPTPANEISAKLTYDHYFENNKTRYTSGDAFLADFAANHYFALPGKFGELGLGVGGFAFRQLSDDRVNGRLFLDGFQGRSIGLGPEIIYAPVARAPAIVLKAQKEFDVRNRPSGERVFFRAVVPF